MDLATLIGLAGAILLIASAVILGVSPSVFINPASLLIVVGGTMFVVLAKFSVAQFLGAFKAAARAFKFKLPETQASIEELVDIANVARKYKLILLSDEIYGEVHFEGRHKSIACYYPEGTIISTGLSKWAGAGGWRLGTFIFPRELRPLQDAMAIIASETYTATSAPIQHAAIAAFNGGEDIDEYLKQSRRVLKVVGEYMHRRLTEMGAVVQKPEGAFYLFPDFSGFREQLARKDIKTSQAFCQALLENTGVAILPASDFGFVPDHLGARLAFVDFDGTESLHLAGTDYAEQELGDDFVKQACPRLVLAMDKMEQWLNSL